MRATDGVGLRRSGWMRGTGRVGRGRVMLTVAAALVVVLGVDPGLLGSVWSSVAHAETQRLVDETREQNYGVADAALDPDVPDVSVPLEHPVPDADDPLDPLVLPGQWPVAATTEVDVVSAEPGTGQPATVQLGGMDVSVAPVTDGTSPERVGLAVLDQVQTEEQGLTGVLLEVSDASTTPTVGEQEVTLSVSYETFAGVAGGDWASRLQAVWVPECDAETDPAPECRPVTLPSEVDQVAQTVTIDVPVTAAPEESAAPATLGRTTTPTTTATATAVSTMSTGSPGGGVAITSGVAGPLGDWSATGLALSSTWGTTGATGAFTWGYPMRVPQVPAGPAPELSLSYNSAVSDGRIPSTNNQSGLIGEGFDIGASFIERTYTSCADDESTGANNVGLSAPDLCWGKENATLSLNGAGTELIKDKTSGTWHPRRDDGTKIEHITTGGAEGEYWKVTTTDGTEYFFGKDADAKSAWTVPVYGNHAGEPGHAATFEASERTQVWRWNLDRVIDPSGNTASYFYAAEMNRYRPFYDTDQVEYVSGGYLQRIEYGTNPGAGATQAPARVEFDHDPRCITDLAVPNSWCTDAQSSTKERHWPDTPVDLICTAGADCTTYAPAFFNRTRLARIITSANTATGYQPVDTWALSQRFVAQGDGIGLEYATGIMLRLDSVAHTGNGGDVRTDVSLPAVRFDYEAKKNRVEVADTGADGLWRHRVSAVRTESGGVISVSYTTGCGSIPADQATNNTLCFPVKWHDKAVERTDWFYKYIVTSVVEGHSDATAAGDELITGSSAVTTTYDYSAADWKWVKPDTPLIDDADKTYSEFRGAKEITTITGSGSDPQTETVTTYYRGTGATLTAPIPEVGTVQDRQRFAGEVFSSTVLNGAIKVSETVTTFGDPVTVATSATSAGFTATRIPSQSAHAATYDAAGALVHRTRSTTAFNAFSQPTTVDDRGDTATAADNLCTTSSYAHETDTTLAGKHLVTLPAAVETVSKACDEQPNRPTDVVSASRLTYDSSGRPTKTETLDPDDGDGYTQTSTVTYDARGRVTQATDAAGQTTTTEYTQSAGGMVTETTTTNPLGHTTTTGFDPLLGVPVTATDANGRTTTGVYDGLGRLTSVTYPQHAAAHFPSVAYEYTVLANGLNAVVTRTLSADGKRQHASTVLYDALLRPFQTQTEGRGTGDPSAGRGRMVAQTIYDSAGRMVRQTEPWFADGVVSATPVVVPSDTSGQTTFEYDAAGRQTAQIFWIGPPSNPDSEQWRTITDYDGATTLQIPPMGATPTETTVDARGRTEKLVQYVRDPDPDLNRDPNDPDQSKAITPSDVRVLEPVTTTYEYDAAGRLTGMTDDHDNQWSYGYDWAGRQITASDPDAGTSTTTYDVLGQVLTRTNGNGQTLGYTYDPLGRTTSIRDGSPTGTVRASWEYDTVLNGVLTSATRHVDGQQYITRTDDWDDAYRPTKTSLVLPDTGAFTNLQTRTISTELEYTMDGQIAAVTYPAVGGTNGTVLGKETVTTVYDKASSMPSWMSGGFGWGTYVASSTFDAAGRPLLTDLGNTYGAVASYHYDEQKRLSGISLDRERINGTELDLTYAYDDAGNVTNITDAPTNSALTGPGFQDNQCFSYDGLARLQTAWTAGNGDCTQAPSAGGMAGAAPYWTNYSYDVLGNRTKQTTTQADGTQETTTYLHEGDGPHAVSVTITGGQTTAYSYDAAGNRTSTAVQDGPSTEYTWDAEGELITAGDTSNVYDAGGNRIIRTDANGTTVYAGGQEIHVDADGEVSATRYYSFAGKMVAIRTDRGLGDGVTSLVTDHHGTPVAAMPNGGHPTTTAINRLYTDPFGAARGQSGADTIPGETQFLGKTRDGATELTLLGARYYDEAVGAFLSTDPILDLGDPQQWNAYAYANNSPISRSDPSGLLALGATDHEDVNGKSFKSKANGTVQASPPKTVKPAVSPGFWSGVGGWIEDNQAEIIGAVVGTVVGVAVTAGCLAGTAGVGSVGCLIAGGAAGGAVGGAITNLWKTQVTRTQAFSWGGLAADTGMGALFGGIAGLAGAGVGAIASKIAAGAARTGAAGALVSAVDNEAARVVASQSIRQRGPVLSGALDRKSGEIFFGQNTGVPSPLHGSMKAAIDAFPGPGAAGKGIPGTHAEINAINQGLYARPGSSISDFALYSVRLRGAQQGSQIMMCPNCSGILNGAEDVIP